MSVPMESEGGVALAASAEWRLLALLFERPRDGWWAEIESLSGEVDSADLRLAAAAAGEAREATYLAMFGPGGSVSPREVAYRGREDLGRILADIAAFHEAFAFQPRAEDPPDHVAVETSFVGYLHFKESYARMLGDGERAQTCAIAAKGFIEAHLRFFAEPLGDRLDAASAPPHLVLAARALVARAGRSPAGASVAGREDARAEFECGDCEPPSHPPEA